MGAPTDIHPVLQEPERYCSGCGYALRGLVTPRCPECGRGFDPADAKTYRKRPPGWWVRPLRRWVRPVKRACIALATVLLILIAVWLWFFWGWYSERQALIALRVDPANPSVVWYSPISPRWPGDHPCPTSFVLYRVSDLNLAARSDLTDLTPVARFAELRGLDLSATSVTDLTPLSGLTNLDTLALYGAPVTNVAPLAGLTKLEVLSFAGTRVTDVTSLTKLHSLRTLRLPKETITEAQAAALRRELPDCTIVRW